MSAFLGDKCKGQFHRREESHGKGNENFRWFYSGLEEAALGDLVLVQEDAYLM